MGPTYDAQEEKEQKVKERHTKERGRRKEQSKKRVPYETFVTLNGLQGAAHLNGQRGRVMDKMINTYRTLPSKTWKRHPVLNERRKYDSRRHQRCGR